MESNKEDLTVKIMGSTRQPKRGKIRKINEKSFDDDFWDKFDEKDESTTKPKIKSPQLVPVIKEIKTIEPFDIINNWYQERKDQISSNYDRGIPIVIFLQQRQCILCSGSKYDNHSTLHIANKKLRRYHHIDYFVGNHRPFKKHMPWNPTNQSTKTTEKPPVIRNIAYDESERRSVSTSWNTNLFSNRDSISSNDLFPEDNMTITDRALNVMHDIKQMVRDKLEEIDNQ